MPFHGSTGREITGREIKASFGGSFAHSTTSRSENFPMAARDDSVIRGSLITCLILLVLSLTFNVIVWQISSANAESKDKATQSLTDARNEIRELEERNILFRAMVGAEQMSNEQFESLANSSSGNEELDTIATQFYNDMQVFGPEVNVQDRNYAKLPEYFMNIIRERNQLYSAARDEAAQVRAQAESDVETARTAQAKAEEERDSLAKQLADERDQFAAYRNDMLQKMESAKDSKTKTERELQALRRQAGTEINDLAKKTKMLENTIETQRLELNTLRNDRFENVQGEIRYVLRGGNIVSVNLGAADALRPGVTFGVIDRDDTTRLQDADVKASIQVTKILGPHLAEARVVATPEVGNPIIEGDAVYSPFWAPGRTVKIALAGEIDIDGDERPDNAALEGMIAAAGAEVVARVLTNGQVEGNLDPSVRFMVVGEQPELDGQNPDAAASQIQAIGLAKQKAIELGITVIPAWKLQAYLRTLDDSLTTPLGSAVRAEDFEPEMNLGRTRRRPTNLPELYKRQRDNVQRTNEIVQP
jgi:hypothetical protein